MRKVGKIIGSHLLILLVYSLIAKFLGKLDGDLTMIIYMILFVLAQTIFCLGMGIKKITESNKQEGTFYLLTSLLVLVVGFATLRELGSVKNIQVQEKNK